jgi:tetratricopeptide (TPR) repeat protein
MDDETDVFDAEIMAALALAGRGLFAAAASAMLGIFARSPRNGWLPDEAGNLYLYQLRRPHEALGCFRLALPLAADPTTLRYRMGVAYATAGDDAAALAEFRLALAATPTDDATLVEVAKVHLRRGRLDVALALLDAAIAHNRRARASGGGAGTHGYGLALVTKARIYLVLRDDLEAGLAVVRALLGELGEVSRCQTLAGALRAAGKHAFAMQVAALREAHLAQAG